MFDDNVSMRFRFWLGLALVVAIAVGSVVAAREVRDNEHEAFERTQRQQALRAAHQAEARAELSLGQLSSAAAYFQVEGDFTQRQFQVLANSLLQSGALSAAAFIEFVPAPERARFERERGFPITERTTLGDFRAAERRPAHFPLSYVATRAGIGTSFPLGYDIGVDQSRAPSLLRARDTATATATEVIRLSLGGAGINVFRPVYRDRAPIRTVKQRRAALLGFATGVFGMADLVGAVSDALPDDIETQLIHNDTTVSGESIPREEAASAMIRIADRSLLLVVRDPSRPAVALPVLILVLGVSLACLLGALVLIWSRSERMQELALQASQDPLTGLKNRRRFEEDLRTELARTRRERSEGALLMLDVDEFKRVNDTQGHPAGDRVIQRIADVLRNRTRETDVLARVGGDEFAVVLPHCSTGEAAEVAEAISESIKGLLPSEDGAPPITVSVGIAMYGGRAPADFESVQADADTAMYEAKQDGRDLVRLADAADERNRA